MMQDEIQEQKEKVKKMNKLERMKYFWYYHWKKVLLAVVFLILLNALIHTLLSNKNDEYLYVAMVNCKIVASSQTDLMDNYAKSRQIDQTKTPAKINVNLSMSNDKMDSLSLANSQSLQAFVETGDYDVLIANDWVIDDFAHQAYLCDLSKTLPSDLYDQIKDLLYYYDYEDGTHIPVGFYADQIEKVSKSYKTEVRPVIAITATSKSPEAAVDFVQYLFE